MKVILLKDVAKLGRKYDTKDVSSGHALNLLIPQKIAVQATPEAIKRYSKEKSVLDAERKIHEDLLVKNINDLEGVEIKISGKANEKGHLFAGIHKNEIIVALQAQTQLQIDPSFIQLEHPIKATGEHMVEVKGAGKTVKIKITISALA
jgi:large subunit ribosomal protein L9